MSAEGVSPLNPHFYIYHHVVTAAPPEAVQSFYVESRWTEDTRVLDVFVVNKRLGRTVRWGFCAPQAHGTELKRSSCSASAERIENPPHAYTNPGEFYCDRHRFYCNPTTCERLVREAESRRRQELRENVRQLQLRTRSPTGFPPVGRSFPLPARANSLIAHWPESLRRQSFMSDRW